MHTVTESKVRKIAAAICLVVVAALGSLAAEEVGPTEGGIAGERLCC